MGATLKTVARAAGVSTTTASNAYNRPDQLSPQVRDRVLRAAATLGYAGPNATARSLRRGRTGTLGVLFSDTLSYALTDPFAVVLLQGIAEVAETRNAALLLLPVGGLDTDAACNAARSAMVDGFCLECIDQDNPIVNVIADRNLPMVSTFRSHRPGLGFVAIDEWQAGHTAGEHLRSLGHSRVGVITDENGADSEGRADHHGRMNNDAVADPDNGSNNDRRANPNQSEAGPPGHDTTQRIDGLHAALSDQAAIAVARAGRNARERGAAAAGRLLDRQDRPTALFCLSDVLAAGALDALAQRGLEPGNDVSVIGFDDLDIARDHNLTTIRQPVLDKGRLAAAHLLDPGDDPVAKLLPTELIVRATTRPAPR